MVKFSSGLSVQRRIADKNQCAMTTIIFTLFGLLLFQIKEVRATTCVNSFTKSQSFLTRFDLEMLSSSKVMKRNTCIVTENINHTNK